MRPSYFRLGLCFEIMAFAAIVVMPGCSEVFGRFPDWGLKIVVFLQPHRCSLGVLGRYGNCFLARNTPANHCCRSLRDGFMTGFMTSNSHGDGW